MRKTFRAIGWLLFAGGCSFPSLEIELPYPDAIGSRGDSVDAPIEDGASPPDALTDALADGAENDSSDGTIIVPDAGPYPDIQDVSDTPAVPDSKEDTQGPIDCGDNDKCTIDLFDDEAGECIYYPVGCMDGIACTLDLCFPESGCNFILDVEATGCCEADLACDDGDPCTFETCEVSQCVYVLDPDPACCKVDVDCDDEDACTLDTCGADGCTYVEIGAPTCCEVHEDCDDGNTCTFDQCGISGCSYASLCCTGDEECAPSSDCGGSTCIDGWCTQTPDDLSCCEEGDLWTPLGSEGNTELNTFASSPHHTWTPENAELMYSAAASWSLVSSSPHTASFTSPELSLELGSLPTLSFEILSTLQVEPFVDLLAMEVLENDGTPHPLWDKSSLTLSGWNEVSLSLRAWVGQTITLRLQYDSVTTDGNETETFHVRNMVLDTTCGVVACVSAADCDDGLETTSEACIEGACATVPAPGTCSPFNAAVCDDGLPCTANGCVGLKCTQTPLEECCLTDSKCDDGNPCTLDICATVNGNFCTHEFLPDCCNNDAECPDLGPCHTSFCHPTEGCISAPNSNCCSTDSECDDGDPCTSNSCVSGTCENFNNCCTSENECAPALPECFEGSCIGGSCVLSPSPQESCCTNSPLEEEFTTLSSGESWSVVADSNPEDGVGWKLQGTLFHSSPYAFYYGNTASWNYDTGSTGNWGTLVSPVFTGPLGARPWVSFHLYLANEFSAAGYENADFDRLQVSALLTTGESIPLWESASSDTPWWKVGGQGEAIGAQWTEIGPILLPLAVDGSWQLAFTFDTLDGSANQTIGLAIDDIRVENACSTP